MESHANGPKTELGYRRSLAPKHEFENTADAAGLWFAAAVMFAVLTAGVIVYRAGGPDIRTASNDVTALAAARSSPAEMPPAYSHIEGIDP
jgi:hypothetical protein